MNNRGSEANKKVDGAMAGLEQLLVQWNSTAAPFPQDLGVHQLFEAQATATPEEAAVVACDEALTYGELDRLANRLAWMLKARNLGPEAPVALFMDRSPEMVVAVLAVLKAGGAYLPIDPATPHERLAFMLEDAAASVLLTRQVLRRGLGDLATRAVAVDLDELRPGSAERPPWTGRPENLAYVIYTSGSTGRPKGTELAHTGLLNLVAWHRRVYEVTAADRATQLAGPGFDAAVWELWPYLSAGAAIHFPPPETAADPVRLLAWLAAERITLSFLPTPLAEAVLAEPLPPGLELRALLTGGDRLHRRPERPLPFELVNHYGPTECTVVTTWTPIESAAEAEIGERAAPPIGRPLANTRIYILDAGLVPVPCGDEGELHVAGVALARGYRGRPALTAKSFVPDPFATAPGERLYKSGDLVRYLPGGDVDFLGRIDHQVKIRGFRIELGEVEVALSQHPAVREVAVVLAGSEPGGPGADEAAAEPRMTAYVVPEDHASEPEPEALRAALARTLPDYMLPVAFVSLQALPLTPNGKIDRAALSRRPVPALPPGDRRRVPCGPAEELLAGIWARLFGVEEASGDDHFFALGGHSLLATRLVSRVRRALGVELPLHAVLDNPTLADLAAVLAAELGRASSPPPVPVSRDLPLPLSFAQQRLWFLDRLEPGSALYNIPVVLRLDGRLERRTLARALNEIVRRHEVLRTRFEVLDERPVQSIRPDALLPLPVLELAALPAPHQQVETRRRVLEEARRPFDLARGPVLRTRLLRLAETEHLLLLAVHHIAFDGWSLDVLLRELAVLYQAFAAGTASPLPELDVQYADFAVWQRRWLTGKVLEMLLAYWRRQLAELPVLELPTDRPRPAVQSFRGGVISFRLPPELFSDLLEVGRRHASTLFMTLLAAFQTLVGRYAGQNDVAVGSPIANRNRAEVEGLVGFFVNTLVLRGDLRGDPTFEELLARVRAVAVAAYAHQDLPFEKLVEELEPERDLSRNPLVQVLFLLQNVATSPPELAPGLAASFEYVYNGTAKFDLTLGLEEARGGLRGDVEYNTDLFDAVTVRRLARHFRSLLEGLVAHPQRRLSELSLLPVTERQQMLLEWNDTASPPGSHAASSASLLVHELFEAQAAETPEAVAVVGGEERLSYQELNRRANRLAHYLRGRGAGEAEALVGICMERSSEMVVAILAVLKASAAYLPLDPRYPRQRLAFMLEDARARVVLTQQRMLDVLPEHRSQVVCLDGDRRAIAGHSSENPPSRATPGNLAYMIYTSGSTGRAKAVAIEHRSAVALLKWSWQVFSPRELAGVLGSTSICFDLSVFELFVPLGRGGSVILADHALELPDLAAAGAVTLVNTVPSALRELLRIAELPPSVRTINLAGEALQQTLVDLAYRQTGVERMLNLYGPSEDTTYSTFACIARQGTTPPIGRPVADTRVCLLDRHRQPVPAGVPGELCLGGEGLARGYFGRPALTAAAFVPDPWNGGGRLYCTGDLARYLPDGTLELLGRRDHQVKLRGFRIELGEIEAVLARQAGVSEAVVTVREDEPGAGDGRLVAYVVAEQETAGLDADALRAGLGESLPDYMVPNAFVGLDALPLTPSGKVDRRALPAPKPADGQATGPGAAPRSPLEEVLAGIFSRVLGLERAGIHDNFFALGGHSLLATQVVSRVRRELGAELPLRTFFERPTIAGLAAWTAAALRREQAGAVPPVRPAARHGRLPLSFAQQRLWFLDRLQPGSALYNIPFTLRFTGRLDPRSLEHALNEIVRRHEVLRTCFQIEDEQPVQVIRSDAFLPLPVPDLTTLDAPQRRAEARRLIREEACRPFDLAHGPVLRTRLLRLAEAEHVLLLTVHHIAFDGWSIGVFLRELVALYEPSSLGTAPFLPELPVQYADFALWQHRWLQGEVLERQSAYWRRQLADLPVLGLPADRPRPAVQSFRGAVEHFRLPAELCASLLELGQQHGATLFMTLLAAFQTLAGRYAGQDDVAVGSPIANRNRAEIEGLVGFFVNTLVLRGDLRGDPTFGVLLARVRDVSLAAYAHQDLPFEKLVEELRPERKLSHNPLVQVIFLLQNVVMAPAELAPQLETSLEHVDSGTAKFDLTLGLEEAEGGLRGELEYSTDLFDRATVRRLAAHYKTLLAGISELPEMRLSGLPLLTPAERQQLEVEWNATAAAPSRDLCHRAFEGWAAAAPEATAVVFGTAALSYGELNRRANRLAHALGAWGVGSDVAVGILMQRSPETLVGILGVLKAGGAYLPLDPASPPDRLSFMLRDAGVKVLLTRHRRREGVGELAARVVCLNAEDPGSGSEGNPEFGVRPENLAYVIYTSGSTGRPKGTELTHAGLANLVAWHRRLYGVTPADRATHLAGPGFDASVWELWPYLASGAAIHIPEPETIATPPPLLAWLADERITLSFLPTPLAEAVLAEPLPEHLVLRALLTGGDRLHRHPGRDLPFALVNNYGPTENTVVTTWAPVGPKSRWGNSPAIGRPLANSRVHLLGPGLRPVPIGVAGELHAAGRGLARGYLRRPALTAASFVPSPFDGRPGARLYKTGDLARCLPDGNVEFLGRIDHQVKLRGFRIELGEIETVLGRHRAVEAAVVVLAAAPLTEEPAGPGVGDQQLVAYVVGHEGLDAGELRAYLRESLPNYMVPAAVVVLEALPLTPNGKVDRGALPAPTAAAWAPADAGTAPRSPLEEALVGIFSQMLGRRHVGIHDNFFEIGGHSLLATQVISRVRRELAVELPLRTLFERPTVAGLAECVAAALRRGGEIELPPITPVVRRGSPPLSFAQQRLWFLDRFEPSSKLYNISVALRLGGRLDLRGLECALNEIVRRHEVLRTCFATEDEVPVQVIRPVRYLPLPVLDLTGLREPQRRAEVCRVEREEADRPFDLVSGPVLRLRLLRLPEEEHVLLLTVHHIAFDGWSLGVFLRELAALYQAFSAGAAPPLPELDVQYVDFAQWQRQWLRGEILEGLLAWWREQLAGLPVLELPTDRPRPAVQSFRGAVEQFRLPAELCEKLQELSRQHGSTLFMTLLAAFQTLAGRYTGQNDVAVGSPIANRNRTEIEGLVGFFVNTLVLRGDLGGNPAFRELLARVRDVTLAAFAHQDLPFERLVEELEPERNLSQNPIVQVFFLLQNVVTAPPELVPGLRTSFGEVHTGTAKFDLTFGLEEAEGGLRGNVEYSTDLFDGVTVRRLVGHFRTLLEELEADPGQRLSDLPLLSAAERQQVSPEWNDTAVAYPATATIHELFEARAAASPEAVAVAFEGPTGLEEEVSYRELNRRANQLAHYLRAQGVGSEVCVALGLERSVEMVVGILGILKAGGVYVPLDTSYPPDRLAFMLQDASSADGRSLVLLTQQQLAERFAAMPQLRRICLDSEWPAFARYGAQNPSSAATAESLAYVMFTSGSTGRPKGVSVSHRAVVRLIEGANYAELSARQCFLQLAPISFDASTLEIWAALLSGGRLVVFAPSTPSLRELGTVLERQRVTTLWLTAGLFHQVVDDNLDGLSGLRQLLAGGDVLSARHVQRVLEELPECRVINGYGPTENTTFTCCGPMREPGEVEDPVSIGRPISSTRTHVLDRHLRIQGVGVPGELCTGGDGLARGYLKRPALTAASFIPDPLADVPGLRLYRTGDVVRTLADGRLQFLGRRDHQVKLRGFRIELGEVEAVLVEHPAVREAAAVLHQVTPEDQRLVAYVVAAEEEATEAGLRSFLRPKLPGYMVPSVFVYLESLPLNPNGKVDRAELSRRSLPAPVADRGRAPAGPIEELLAAIWAQVLGVEKVGVHDNFFELGGHSLLATRMVSRIRRELRVEAPLRIVFERPTVAALAEYLTAALRCEGPSEAPPLRPAPRRESPPLSFAQQRLWFLDRFEPDSVLYNIPTALGLEGPLDTAALSRALSAIVRRHEVLRTTYETVDGEAVQVIVSALTLPLPVVDLRALPATARHATARRLARAEAHQPFDLSCGPVLRIRLLRLDPAEHVLLFTVHHVAFDGWSLGVFLRELAAFYQAFAAGTSPPVPELEVQYADFAVWQRQWLTGEDLERHLTYWREQLADLPVLELPTDRPRPAVQSFRGAVEHFRLPAQLSSELQELSRRHGSTLFMTLLAAFQTLAGRYTAQDDVPVGSPIANRNRAETEELVGFFVNTLVLRGDLAGDPTFDELLARVRDVALAAYAHQDLPFEKLVEELDPQRNLSQSPLVQALFLLQNVAAAPPELAPGLGTSLEFVHTDTAKFDLTVSLEETEEGLRADLEYNTDLFDGVSIRRLAGHFRHLLQVLAADPKRRLSELTLQPAVETHQMLLEWNDTELRRRRQPHTPPGGLLIHELFGVQVTETPEAMAVICGHQRLSYRELDRRANRLAHDLRGRGVGPEVLVGICTERSAEMVVAILATLKAGAAYLPLDPRYPRQRLAFMLEDARAQVVLTHRSLLDVLPEHRAQVVCLDGDRRAMTAHGSQNPSSPVTGGNLAYMIYTSGSTGRAKGVAIEHRSAVALLEWSWEVFSPRELAGVLGSTSICFDLSIFELFVPLGRGGTVIVADDALAFPGLVAQSAVTLVNTVPSALRELLRIAELPGSLRTINLAGEVLQPTLVEKAYRQTTAGRVFNLYGPSEDTTYSTFALMARASGASAPIGRPVANTQVCLLDRYGRPVPIGVAGELCLGGDGLARGYFGRPALTAAAFVPDPRRGDARGLRLYRTGDLARYLPQGTLEFLGRRDHQVKLRGFRIELGEIEAVLARQPGVREAVVAVREDFPGSGEGRLVAYVVTEPKAASLESGALRAGLGESLPDYMVPGTFVWLDALPLTPSGKVDRRALPAPEPADSRVAGTWTAPRSPLEEALARIFSQVLGRDRVGVNDNFFELGGHSLLATKVLSRVRRELAVELPLRTLFERPTVAGLAESVAAALRRDEGLEAPPVRPVARHDRLPLSFAQQRLWFLDRFEPDSVLYNIPTALGLEGPLDTAALGRAVGEIVRRHEVLRTTYETSDRATFQVISSARDLALPVFDLQALPEASRGASARYLARAEARQPFDLSRGPVLRIRLLRLGMDSHILLLTVHHIAFDGWSLDVFLRELKALYQAFCAGASSPLPELDVQYADFALWQRQWLQGEALERQLAYWREQLAELPVLELPTDRPRPAVRSFRGAVEHFRLPAELSRKLQELSRQHGSTLFMTLLAAFKTLLRRYTAHDDVAVGSPVANRNRAEIEGLVGFFVNTLVLRSGLGGDPTFGELLSHVRDVALAAYAHQDLPFEKLVEELEPERNPSQNPLVQVLFLLQNVAMGPPELAPGLAASLDEVYTGTAKFDLTVGVEETQGELRGDVEYDIDLFDRTTIARLAGHFQSLLGAVAARPQGRVSSLEMLSPAERWQVRGEWNVTAAPYPREVSLAELFEAQTARTPDAAALVFDGRCGRQEWLSYGELNRRANRLAHRLCELGVAPETPVALRLERSPEMVVALLAILKAGGCYLPLDLQYPVERLAFMLADSGAPLLLTQRKLAASFVTGTAPTILMDGERATEPRRPAHNLAPRSSGAHLAYAIYTSGSTGTPKGVAVPQRAVSRLVLGTDYVRLGAADRVAQASNASFDAATFEIWGALLTGACLVGIGKEVALSPPELERRIREQRITAIFVTTALFNLLARETPAAFGTVRHVLFGGEAVDPSAVREVLACAPPERLLHVYGPTESTTFTSWHRVSEVAPTALTVPIGRPVANTRIHVLDVFGSTAPAGVAGELVIGGDGLARGYLGRPGLTAEKLVPDPRDRPPGGRLYRTGDLVRLSPAGDVEFLGRIDTQVKIRGFRIELGEIEAALGLHPAVAQAAVVAWPVEARGDVSGARSVEDKRLVVYFVAEQEPPPAAAALRGYLEESLPEYMVPVAFAALEALPLNANGKVDRRALPAPVFETDEKTHVEPRTPVEEILAGIWSEVLGVDRVGIHDDFFDLGGHSLLATQVVSRVRRELGVEVPLRTLFERPTVAGLAESVAAALRRDEGPEVLPIEPAAGSTLPPLSFAQQRLWFLDRLAPDLPVYNIPITLRLSGPLDLDSLERALGEIVDRHEVLRTCYETVGERPVQVVRPVSKVRLPVLDLAGLPAPRRLGELRRHEVEEARSPFDLARGPVLRLRLVELALEEHALLFTVHHIAFDGWSLGVFLRELAALYQAFTAAAASPLAAPDLQYADFAVWQQQWLSGEVLERLMGYWQERLAGLTVLALPLDRQRAPLQSLRSAEMSFRLPPELSSELRGLSQRHGSTLFMTLLAAFQVLLGRYSGQDDIAVGSPIANRTRSEIEGIVGFFVNTLVLRGDLGGNPPFSEFLGRVRDTALAAYAHQDLPFEKLVEELQPERNLSQNPLVQVFFEMQNVDIELTELAPGVAARVESVPPGMTDFDLSLTLTESEGRLEGELEYNADLFDATRVRRMLRHFECLLAAAVTSPGASVGELPILPAVERHQLFAEWNDRVALARSANGIHQLFEARAAGTPEAEALVDGGRRLTYGDLNARANQLAHYLLRHDVAEEEVVAICLGRGAELIVAVLAVLKAGGAYVMLDPMYPPQRLAFMLEDTQAPVLLTERELLDSLPESGARAVCLDAEEERVARHSAGNPAVAVERRRLAYVVYTSGSLGKPKGVMVPHGSLVDTYRAWEKDYRLRAWPGCHLQMASPSFDVFTGDWVRALCSGGKLVLCPWETLLEPEKLYQLLRRAEVDCAEFVPAVLRGLISYLEESGLSLDFMRLLAVGSDTWFGREHERAESFCGAETRFVNSYGVAEVTIDSTRFERLATDLSAEKPVPIGRPFGGNQVYLLGADLRPVPCGIPAELHLGGSSLARGYLARPGMTAQRFIPDPFNRRGGERLYRTGDLVRHLPDGNVDFLGRVDHQVKLRGFRIELGEIEAALDAHPAVLETVVVLRQDGVGHQQLVGYVVAAPESKTTAEELRRHLKHHLPEYMVPAAVVLLDAMPLTPNGKVDRAALSRRALPEAELADAETYAAPETEVEEILVKIWGEILGVERLGVFDNFFDLGGHSLLVPQLMARLGEIFQLELPVRIIFEAPTVAEMAVTIEEMLIERLEALSEQEAESLLAAEVSSL